MPGQRTCLRSICPHYKLSGSTWPIRGSTGTPTQSPLSNHTPLLLSHDHVTTDGRTETDGETDKETDIEMDKDMDRQTDKDMDRQTDKDMDRQTDR